MISTGSEEDPANSYYARPVRLQRFRLRGLAGSDPLRNLRDRDGHDVLRGCPFFDACAKPAVDLKPDIPCVRSIGMGRGGFESSINSAKCFRDDGGTEWGFLETVEDEATMSGLEAQFVLGELLWRRVNLSSSR